MGEKDMGLGVWMATPTLGWVLYKEGKYSTYRSPNTTKLRELTASEVAVLHLKGELKDVNKVVRVHRESI